LLLDYNGERFYLYAMELFFRAGHVFTSEPIYANHSSEQFIYFDNKSDVSFSPDQRSMLSAFNNISRLFSVNGCTFFSINLLTLKHERSQIAHDIHTMIHAIIGSNGTICLFRHDEEIMLSFIGYGCRCILSDWYQMEDDYDHLLERLDIANISIEQGVDYFSDIVYILARSYYQYSQPSTYDILPINFISNAEITGIDKEELDRYIENELAAPQRKYGDDYVEYDESVVFREANFNVELDLMLLEMDYENDNPFDEEIESKNEDLYEDNLFEEEAREVSRDEYEFNDVNPDIFRDPTLMVKWLNKHE
jgi:hypothetical protein